MSDIIYTNSLTLRAMSDDSRASGYTVQLLPEGGTAPGELITLTQDTGKNWQYNFPAAVTNGVYDVYVGGVAVKHNGIQEKIRVIRDGIVKSEDVDFAKDW